MLYCIELNRTSDFVKYPVIQGPVNAIENGLSYLQNAKSYGIEWDRTY